jgi:hypothetical protein
MLSEPTTANKKRICYTLDFHGLLKNDVDFHASSA